MSERRRGAATATLGYSGLVGAGALRHTGLERAYRGGKRPPLLQEVQFMRRGVRGKVPYLAGAALAIPSGTAAAYGTTRLLGHHEQVGKREQKRKSFLREGIEGTKESLVNRSETLSERPPAQLVAGNYALGAAIGSGAGGLAHLGLGRAKVPGALRAGLATAAGVAAGSATIPAQSRLIRRASRGKYEATSGGVRRVEKMSPRAVYNSGSAKLGAHWTTRLSRVADRVEPYEAKRRAPVARPVVDRHLPNAARVSSKLVKTGRSKAAETLRTISYDVSALNDKDKLVRDVATGQGRLAVAKADDLGATMSRAERRARVTAAGPPIPIAGDIAQAVTAARLSPQKYRVRTAAQNYTSGTAAGLAGNVAGAAGAAALAERHGGFRRKATAANDAIDGAKAKARQTLHLKPAGPSATARVLSSDKTPAGVKRFAEKVGSTRAARLVARNPKVAAVGALAGGAVGGQAGQQAMYSRIMSRDDRYRRVAQASRGERVAKDAVSGMSRRDELRQIKRKQRAAVVNAGTSAIGVGSLAALGAAALPKVPHDLRGKLVRTATVAGTAGGGLGALNGLESAHLARRDLRARRHVLERSGVSKGLVGTGIRRAPAMRRSFIRQTRYPSGLLRVSSVRGGLA